MKSEQVVLVSVVLTILLVAQGEGYFTKIYTDGVLTSRNYPSSYSSHLEDTWLFDLPEGRRMSVEFETFAVEVCRGTNCTCDYVAFYDGDSIYQPLLGKFCGNDTPPPIIGTKRRMLMVFKTDGSVVKKGFRATHTIKYDVKKVFTNEEERKMTNHFLHTKRQDTLAINKWGPDLTRTAVALFLRDPRFFAAGNETGEEIAYELTLQLMSKLVMKKQISTKDLALFVNAMTVACINPKNFFGINIVSQLRKRVDNSIITNPFFMLALCIGEDAMKIEDARKLHKLFHAHFLPSWTGTQAMVFLALKCISRQLNTGNVYFEEMIAKIKEKQQYNGRIEDLKTTALVIQALKETDSYASNFNMSKALRSILEDMKHTYIGIEEMYYILPIFQWKTLLDINSNHCDKTIKTDLKEIVGLHELVNERIQVQISIVIGDDMDFSRTWKIKVPSDFSLYRALENISSTEPDFKIRYTYSKGNPYVSSVSHFRNSIEERMSWFVYTKPLSSDDDLVLIEKSPIDISLTETEELVLWYKSGSWPSKKASFIGYASSGDSSGDTSEYDISNSTDTDYIYSNLDYAVP